MPTENQDVDLTPFNTFGLAAQAKRLITIHSDNDARAFAADNIWGRLPLVLGGGSNLVLTSKDIPVVLKVEIAGRRKLEAFSDSIIVEGCAGENWHDFVRWTLGQGWPGLENLSFIPGTVGAAPVQNIGAYGVELSDRFESLDAIDLTTGESAIFDKPSCQFGYRDSVFKRDTGRWLITAVRFRLPYRQSVAIHYGELRRNFFEANISDPTPLEVSDLIIDIRSQKLPDPEVLGSAGSFFKNPLISPQTFRDLLARYPSIPHYPQADGSEKIAAGWLIEQCGWKGKRLGPAGCHEHQALVLVNHGGATGADILQLAEAIQHDVEERFGLVLEIEPVFV